MASNSFEPTPLRGAARFRRRAANRRDATARILSCHTDFSGQCEEASGFHVDDLGGRREPCMGSRTRLFRHHRIHMGNRVVQTDICMDGAEMDGADMVPDRCESQRGFYALLPRHATMVGRSSMPWKIHHGGRKQSPREVQTFGCHPRWSIQRTMIHHSATKQSANTSEGM